MTENVKETSKNSENGSREKINGSLFLIMKEEKEMLQGIENVKIEGTTDNGKG